MRGIAVLLVVVYHTHLGPLQGGFVGVDVFFVISGFVITRLLVSELVDTAKLRLGRFYLRRIRRLLPALGLAVGGVGVVSLLLAPIGAVRSGSETGVATLLISANARLFASDSGYFAFDTTYNPFLHTWSLSVEEQFYLFLPATIFLAWRLGGKTRFGPRAFTFFTIAAISAVSLLMSVDMSNGTSLLPVPRPADFAFYASPVRTWEFGAGVLVALWGGSLAMPARAATVLRALGLLVIAGVAISYDDAMTFPGIAAAVPVLATVSLLVAGEGRRRAPLLESKPLVWIGDLSYSWYLWHWPLIVWARALTNENDIAVLMAAALSILPAWLSYRFVETPIRANRSAPARRTVALAAGFIVVPLVVCLAVIVAFSHADRIGSVNRYDEATAAHLDKAAGCGRGAVLDAGSSCSWGKGNRAVALLGDSTAGQFSDGLLPAAKQVNASLTMTTFAACPFLDIRTRENGAIRDDCRRYVRESLKRLGEQHFDVVVVSTSMEFYLGNDWEFFDDAAGRWTRDVDRKVLLARDAFRAMAATSAKHGTQFVLVHSILKFDAWDSRRCPLATVIVDEAACGVSSSRSSMEARRRSAIQAEDGASDGGATVLDVADDLCPGTTCSAFRDGRWWYRDANHISVAAAVYLSGRFADVLGSS